MYYSYDNIRKTYDSENRKGMIPMEEMSDAFRSLVRASHLCIREIQYIKKLKRDEERARKVGYSKMLKWLGSNYEKIKSLKEEELQKILKSVESRINEPSSFFKLVRDPILYNGKEYFKLVCSDPLTGRLFNRMLNREVKTRFNVCPANRHHVLEVIKLLLEEKKERYIIRTDISSFFESIDQRRLIELVWRNPHICKKSKKIISVVLSQYDDLKTETPKGQGVPRGVGISSYLAEIYMREIDEAISSHEGVIAYFRYVDDMFIITSHISSQVSLDTEYLRLMDYFNGYHLQLHSQKEENGKVTLYHYSGSVKKKCSLTYLGYGIELEPGSDSCLFALSKKKRNALKEKVDKAFDHFHKIVRFSPRKARGDLIDALNFISGNYKLRGLKSNICSGLYYTNHLLSDTRTLKNATCYLRHKTETLNPYSKVFNSAEDRKRYIERLKCRLAKIDFQQRWTDRKMYSFSTFRMMQLKAMLS